MALTRTKSPPTPGADPRDEQGDCTTLTTLLETGDPTMRRRAARDLAEHPGAATVLVGRLQRESEVSVRAAIFATLTSLAGDTVVAGLAQCLRSEDAALRNEAIEALKQMPVAVAPIIRGLLADTDPDVRIFAVNVLESLCHPDVETWLIEVIEADEHLNVCATAVDLLGEVGSSAARDPLRRLMERYAGEPYIVFAADLALKRITDVVPRDV